MIQRILIANRGEIACRIIATARRLGIETVAVFSDADRHARHVRLADRALRLGPAPAAESYLRIDALIGAARETGAQAIHPGYGFLSENAAFAQAVEEAGLTFIGPSADTIRAMGPKDEAKRIAEAAGVPVLPGYRGADQSLATLQAEAARIGFPLLIKAVAGGGGRGIREVGEAGALAAQLESAVREATAAFGDGRVMLEKLVQRPRHIEVQVFGDGQGGAVHLFERDCSLQRRRQKVVEEAPAPGMPDDVRAAMTDAAVRLAQAVKYRGAGTVEFIVDGARPLSRDSFHFLEMNTRLQVEHPVTEMVTGIDLVEWQLRVAAGEPIPLPQSAIALTGHAIEARICAEDPADGFRPGAGRLALFDAPDAAGDDPHLRWETGFETGDIVPSHYDSMLAKLVVSGADREAASARLVAELSALGVAGVPSNVGFLLRCVNSEAFASGTHHVNTIAEMGSALTDPPAGAPDGAARVAAEVLLSLAVEREPAGLWQSPWNARDGFRMNAPARRRVAVSLGGPTRLVDLDADDGGALTDACVTPLSPDRLAVTLAGVTWLAGPPDHAAEADALGSGDDVSAPMPGRLIALPCAPGMAVRKGDTVAVIEAMKMEHSLPSPRDGVIADVLLALGAQLAEGDRIVTLEPEAASGASAA